MHIDELLAEGWSCRATTSLNTVFGFDDSAQLPCWVTGESSAVCGLSS